MALDTRRLSFIRKIVFRIIFLPSIVNLRDGIRAYCEAKICCQIDFNSLDIH